MKKKRALAFLLALTLVTAMPVHAEESTSQYTISNSEDIGAKEGWNPTSGIAASLGSTEFLSVK